MKNNGRFRFGIPKNIEIDTYINYFNQTFSNLLPFLGALLWPPDGADLKNNNRFRFSVWLDSGVVETRTHNLKVVGSSPAPGSVFTKCKLSLIHI